MANQDEYRQRHIVDPDDISDVTWRWGEVLTARATSIDSAVILVGETPVGEAAGVTVVVPSQVDGTNVVIRVQLAADTNLTCRATFANGERRDWTQFFTVRDA